jgi:predicted HNH restriction endonuclease
MANRQGTLFCEVCSFNFSLRYPQIGEGFIECHHKTPMSKGIVRRTTAEDLALVCPNCHRMLHKIVDGDTLTIEQLTKIYQSQ